MSIPSALGGAGVAALGACLSVSRLLLGLAPFTDVRFWPEAVISSQPSQTESRKIWSIFVMEGYSEAEVS